MPTIKFENLHLVQACGLEMVQSWSSPVWVQLPLGLLYPWPWPAHCALMPDTAGQPQTESQGQFDETECGQHPAANPHSAGCLCKVKKIVKRKNIRKNWERDEKNTGFHFWSCTVSVPWAYSSTSITYSPLPNHVILASSSFPFILFNQSYPFMMNYIT